MKKNTPSPPPPNGTPRPPKCFFFGEKMGNKGFCFWDVSVLWVELVAHNTTTDFFFFGGGGEGEGGGIMCYKPPIWINEKVTRRKMQSRNRLRS